MGAAAPWRGKEAGVMKMIRAMIRPESEEQVMAALEEAGIAGLTKDQLSNCLLHGSVPSLEPAASGRVGGV